MSIKSFRVLWITIRIENKRFLRIPFPVPLFIFQELLDCFLDLINAACFFTPKADGRESSSRSKIFSVKETIFIVMKLLNHLGSDEPYDLVDVAADNCRVLIKVK